MFSLTRHEKIVIIFLLLVTLIGVGVNYYKKTTQQPTLPGAPFEIPKSQTHAYEPVNINTANAEQLSALPGVGAVLAEEIVAYRNTHGPFEHTEDVMEVKGIGQKKFAKIKELIVLK